MNSLRYQHRRAALVAVLGVAALGAAACNESKVTDFNRLTAFPRSAAALQNAYTGMLSAPRADMFWYVLSMEGFGRNALYYTASEQRFATQYGGIAQLDLDNFGARVWDNEFTGIKVADSLQGILAVLQSNQTLPAANFNALLGASETFKALMYMYLAETRDTNGVPVNGVGLAAPAPILCNKDVWHQIVQMLDTAISAEVTAGPGATVGPPGAPLSNPLTATVDLTVSDGWLAFAHALRGKALVEYAYSIARVPPAGSFSAPGTPDAASLQTAITDILDSSGGLYASPLSPADSNPFNDAGVFHSYSTASGDQANPINAIAPLIYALKRTTAVIDTVNDRRWTSKFVLGQLLASNIPGATLAGGWTYTGAVVPGTSSPLPIVRNVMLHFYLAEAYAGLGQTASAVAAVNDVRVNVGGLAPQTPAAGQAALQQFIVNEVKVSTIFDGTGDTNIALREFGLTASEDTGDAFPISTLQITQGERDGRGGAFAHAACTTTP